MDYLPLAMIQRCSVENLIFGGERLLGIYRMKDMNLLKGMILGLEGKTNTTPSSKNQSKGNVCPYCGQSSQTVFVHGHEQCVVCKMNVEPCCQGQGLDCVGDE